MKAAFFAGKDAVEVREVNAPEPGSGEVLVRVRSCGVCGSDLHFYHGQFPSNPNFSPGHEFAGEIAALGEGVRGFEVGQRVCVEPLITCRECSYCRTGQYQLCTKRVLFGTFAPGAMAEYVLIPSYTLYPLPETLDWGLGALVEPMAVCVHGMHIVDVRPGDRVLVMGSGAIGLLSVLAARAFGASEVIATYRHDHQGRSALAMGATRILKDGETSGIEKEGIDAVIETVGGTAPTLGQAVGIVRPGGRVSVLGVFAGPATVNALALMLKEVRMVGGITYCRPAQHSDFDTAIGLLTEHADRARTLITHTFGLEDAGAAFATAADKSTGAVKVQVRI
jgi:2-desacetyl-2-hydroxyethyl bacteriochlorophyllide A dehydrogenase